jgi:tetratricopeptide (TPR) repeat protein
MVAMANSSERPIGPEGELDSALALHQSGRLEQAEFLYRKILRGDPNSFEAQLLLGILLGQKGINEEALTLLDAVLAIEPNLAVGLLNKGNVLAAMALSDEALGTYNRGLSLHPQNAELMAARSMVYVNQRRYDEALADLDVALKINPAFPEAQFHKGNALQGLKRYTEAIQAYSCAIELQPDRADWYNHRANALRMARRPEEALSDTDTALRLDPNNQEALNDRGNALQELNRFDDAILCYNRILAIRPDYTDALINRGAAYRDLKKFADALGDFDRALAISPGNALAQWSKGIVKLLTGQLREGLALYEWRKKMPARIEAREYEKPLWTGDQDIVGKTLFLYIDQGLGDTIQFYRYAVLAKSRGARIILSVNSSIIRLLQEADPDIQVVDRTAAPPQFDFHAPLMSLPFVFGTTMQSIPTAITYLRPNAERVRKWATRIGPEGFKIGISWQGGPAVAGRSFPLMELAPIAQLPGVRLISLQKGPGISQLASLPSGMVVENYESFDAGDDAFRDTVPILPSLDLVITADTSLAHLAGTLNRPTWVALKYVPDWRWFLDRQDSPWYPSLLLFRQDSPGHWACVFEQMKERLLAHGVRRA